MWGVKTKHILKQYVLENHNLLRVHIFIQLILKLLFIFNIMELYIQKKRRYLFNLVILSLSGV